MRSDEPFQPEPAGRGEGEVEEHRVRPAERSQAARAAAAADGAERARRDPGAIRAEDTEPYVALQYVARLFKIVAMVVIVALTLEVLLGMYYEGVAALLPLLTEVVKGGVLAAILWGVSDLTLLFIDVGHDVRAARVLLGRLSARGGGDPFPRRGPEDGHGQ